MRFFETEPIEKVLVAEVESVWVRGERHAVGARYATGLFQFGGFADVD